MTPRPISDQPWGGGRGSGRENVRPQKRLASSVLRCVEKAWLDSEKTNEIATAGSRWQIQSRSQAAKNTAGLRRATTACITAGTCKRRRACPREGGFSRNTSELQTDNARRELLAERAESSGRTREARHRPGELLPAKAKLLEAGQEAETTK
ncbi:large ribosomal subunit protein eL19-like [Pseudorca crassidens]|uniref:large ribosomal subunit protein eL19-like n=1 Tax=Pseudorca crassidens TaxID=82174 RepID=UPI00352C8C24